MHRQFILNLHFHFHFARRRPGPKYRRNVSIRCLLGQRGHLRLYSGHMRHLPFGQSRNGFAYFAQRIITGTGDMQGFYRAFDNIQPNLTLVDILFWDGNHHSRITGVSIGGFQSATGFFNIFHGFLRPQKRVNRSFQSFVIQNSITVYLHIQQVENRFGLRHRLGLICRIGSHNHRRQQHDQNQAAPHCPLSAGAGFSTAAGGGSLSSLDWNGVIFNCCSLYLYSSTAVSESI